jgi:hypothetical protein
MHSQQEIIPLTMAREPCVESDAYAMMKASCEEEEAKVGFD